MSSEKRKLPDSNIKRNYALKKAKRYNDNLKTPTYLSTSTETKMNDMQPMYSTAYSDVTKLTAKDMRATELLISSRKKLHKASSRFIKVFALAVDDDEFDASDFLFYHLYQAGHLPAMETDDELSTATDNLISGEAARVAKGGIPMSNPDIAKIIMLNTAFNKNKVDKNLSITNLTAAEYYLNSLNTKADEVILFVYNEVETNFSNLSNAAIRVQGKLWGIPYVKVGGTKIIRGKVTDINSGANITDALIYLSGGRNQYESDINGYELSTTLMDVQYLISEHPLYKSTRREIKLVEGKNSVADIVMKLKPVKK